MAKPPDRPRKPPSKAAIRRAVASSTAIETGQRIDQPERRLRASDSKFRHLGLAK
jgi:hypothetical protein